MEEDAPASDDDAPGSEDDVPSAEDDGPCPEEPPPADVLPPEDVPPEDDDVPPDDGDNDVLVPPDDAPVLDAVLLADAPSEAAEEDPRVPELPLLVVVSSGSEVLVHAAPVRARAARSVRVKKVLCMGIPRGRGTAARLE